MTQPILNSNVVTSIDHEAGSSPVLGQIPEHTQDELKALAQYHLEKFKNWMRPLMDPKAISSEITIQMPPVKLPAKK